MVDIVKLEKTLFSSLQSEFQILLNKLNDNSITYSNNYFKKLLLINKQIMVLENMINELKIDIIKNESTNISLEVKDNLKDIKTIELFKPYMLYYRFLLDN